MTCHAKPKSIMVVYLLFLPLDTCTRHGVCVDRWLCDLFCVFFLFIFRSFALHISNFIWFYLSSVCVRLSMLFWVWLEFLAVNRTTEQPNNQHSFMEVTVFSCYVLFFFWIELFLSVFIHFVSFRLCVVFFFLFFQYFVVLRTKGILWKLASENNKHGREKTRSCRRWMVESLVMMSVMTEKASYRRIKTKNQAICSSFFRPIHRFFLLVVNVVVIIIIIANFFSFFFLKPHSFLKNDCNHLYIYKKTNTNFE